jgi:hypothetical protein
MGKMKLYIQIKISKTKGIKRKEIKKYKDQNQLSMQTLKVPLSFVVFSISVPYLSIMSLLKKSESIDLQFDHKKT